ncbi:MAG: four helix bundle protein [Patescibacteria group bacterium]
MTEQENGYKIRSFTDLRAWKEGHKLVLAIYSTTDRFPMKEQFGLSTQMRRAAVSITSNIAEGFCRSTAKDKRQYYIRAEGSLIELQNQLLIAWDVGYTNDDAFRKNAHQTVSVHKLINGLKRIKDL